MSDLLRATDSAGEVYDDPSKDALFMFMEDLEPGGVLRVERLEEERKEEWAEVGLNDAGLYRFWSSGHIEYVTSFREVHDLLTRWALDLWG